MGFASKIQLGANQHSIGASLYGTCDTAANVAAKVVVMPDFDALIAGTTIHVKFTNTNTAANPTLNVGGTGAKPIYRHGVTTPGTGKIGTWAAGAVVSMTLVGNNDDGYSWMMEEPFDLTQMVNFIYPVGSIYMSVNSTSPATLFGGTWTQIKDTFLLSAGDTYTAGNTGGAATTTLATTNLPSHTHQVGAHAHGLNSHTHSIGAHAHGLNGHTHTGPSHSHTVNSHTHSIPSLSGTAASAGAHTHQLKFQKYPYPTGSGQEPYFVDVGGDHQETAMVSAGAHTHSVTTTASTTGGATSSTNSAGTGKTGGPSVANTANSTAFNSGGPSTSNTANSSAFNTGATGSGTAFSNMPPYLAVFVWQRVA